MQRFSTNGVGMVQFSLETPVDGTPASPGNGVHVAFMAEDPDMVDEFYRVALEHGGTDDGPPGLRPQYNAHYYGAFVRDPDGNKIEAATHSGPSATGWRCVIWVKSPANSRAVYPGAGLDRAAITAAL